MGKLRDPLGALMGEAVPSKISAAAAPAQRLYGVWFAPLETVETPEIAEMNLEFSTATMAPPLTANAR